MDDLGSILDELRSESTGRDRVVSRTVPPGYLGSDIDLMNRPMPTKDIVSGTISLTMYEAWWLEWRLRVHLRSYRAMGWKEMEEVITCLVNRLTLLSTSTTSCMGGPSTPVGECSVQPSTPAETSHS